MSLFVVACLVALARTIKLSSKKKKSGLSQFKVKVTVIINGFGESLTKDPTISIPYCVHHALEHFSFSFLSRRSAADVLHGNSFKFD